MDSYPIDPNINMMSRQTGKTHVRLFILLGMQCLTLTKLFNCPHKYTGAQEIMARILMCTKLVPDLIRAGVTSYNKGPN